MDRMVETRERNIEIDCWKFIFSIVIMLHHSYQLFTAGGRHILCGSGALTVDFFFIVSGYFMAANINSAVYPPPHTPPPHTCVGESSVLYMKKQFLRIYPNVLFTFLLCFTVRYILQDFSLSIMQEAICGSVFELLFLRMFGIQARYSNPLTWYISAMMIGKAIIYPCLLKWKRDFTHIAAPLGMLFLLGGISHEYGAIGFTYTWNGIFYVGILRAFMGLLAGNVCFEVSSNLRSISFTTVGRHMLTILELGSATFLLIYIQFFQQGQGDFFIFLLFMLLVVIICSQKSSIAKFFKNSKLCLLGRFSLAVYLNQAVLLLLAQSHRFGNSFKQELIVYVIGTLGISIISLPFATLFQSAMLRVKRVIFAQ